MTVKLRRFLALFLLVTPAFAALGCSEPAPPAPATTPTVAPGKVDPGPPTALRKVQK